MQAAIRSSTSVRPSIAGRTTHAARGRCLVVPCRANIKVGDMLPAFELQTDNNTSINSQDMVKDSGAIIFIYPKADTSGCTFQACGFNDNMETFNAAGYKIYGLSADLPQAQASWKQAQGYRYPLLCDPEFKVLPLLCGSQPGSKINRTHVIVAKGGKVVDVKLGVGSKDSVPDALKFIAEAKSA